MPEARFSCTLHPPESRARLWLLVQPGAAVAIYKRLGAKDLSSTPAVAASHGGTIDLEMKLLCECSGRLRVARMDRYPPKIRRTGKSLVSAGFEEVMPPSLFRMRTQAALSQNSRKAAS